MKKNAQAWKQFYSGDVSGKGAPQNQELRYFLTTFLAYLLPLSGNGIAAAKHFPTGGSIQFFCRRCPFPPQSLGHHVFRVKRLRSRFAANVVD
jgi:hypothetical protein